MKRNFISLFSIITGVILLSTCTSAPEHQKPGGRSGVVFMDKKMFIEYLEENGLTTEQFVITIDGSNQEACFTKEKYVYFECVVYMGEDDVKSTCQSPYITEDRYFLVYEDMRVEVNYRDVRLYVKPAYEKFYDKSNAEDAPEFIRDIVVNESGQALAAEYGLKKRGHILLLTPL